jgi:putative endonuclease
MRTYYVYILTNRRGTLYVGVTNNLERRLHEHRHMPAATSFTSRYRITRLVYFEVAENAREAIAREKQIKGWTRERKLALIRPSNPPFRDLAPKLFGWRPAPFHQSP